MNEMRDFSLTTRAEISNLLPLPYLYPTSTLPTSGFLITSCKSHQILKEEEEEVRGEGRGIAIKGLGVYSKLMGGDAEVLRTHALYLIYQSM